MFINCLLSIYTADLGCLLFYVLFILDLCVWLFTFVYFSLQVFGFRCVQVHHASQKCYILINNLRMEEAEELVDWCVRGCTVGMLEGWWTGVLVYRQWGRWRDGGLVC